jgi:hypothetical protein
VIRSLAPFLAFSLGLVLVAPAVAAAPVQTVSRDLIKIGVEKVLSVKLAPGQTKGAKDRLVSIKLAATFPSCAQGEAFAFKEGTWEQIDYLSYWAGGVQPCAAGAPVDLDHSMRLAPGKAYTFVFRGPKKWDQKVGFKVVEDGIQSLIIRKIPQQ